MQLSNGLVMGLETRQQLTINTDVLQSLEILRLPMQELQELLVQKTYDNPVLEMDAAQQKSAEETEEELSEVVPAEDLHSEEPHSDDAQEEFVVEAVQNDIWSAGATGGDAFRALGGSEKLFTEMLCEQLGTMDLDNNFAMLCRYIIASLDRKGYFCEPPEEMAELLGCTVFDVMQALYWVQSLEPAGVGARNLEECLLLQLVQGSDFNQHTIRLVKDGMPLLAANDMKGISSLLGVDAQTAQKVCKIVRGLNPIPSQGYYTGEARQTVIPDAMVEKRDGGFQVIYNQSSAPTLRLNREYVEMIPALDDAKTKEYLQRNLSEARQLMNAVEKRENTLTRIITQIVQMQPVFFEDGQSLVPMTMDAVAGELELNISTISRAVQSKYIRCAAGTVELKSLFTTAVKGTQGDLISAAMVKRMIKGIVDGENTKKPMSDEAIRRALELASVSISRRTVAKYREELGILSSSLRKVMQ